MMECKYTPRLGAEAVHLLKEGKSFSAVGRALGVHRDTIKNWGKRYDLELGKAVVEAKPVKDLEWLMYRLRSADVIGASHFLAQANKGDGELNTVNIC